MTFSALRRDCHTLSAETTVQSKFFDQPKFKLIAGFRGTSDVHASQLWTLTALELRKVQDHVLSFAKPARERVAGFIVEMAQRLSANEEVELPMKRQDIADYLGLTIETVSRTLTQLENASAIELPTSRRIVLRNRTALGRLNG